MTINLFKTRQIWNTINYQKDDNVKISYESYLFVVKPLIPHKTLMRFNFIMTSN